MKYTETAKYEHAKKQVNCIKGFYNHLIIYLIVNLTIILICLEIIPIIYSNSKGTNFQSWLDWNTYGIAIFWGLGVLIHAIWVFKYKFTYLKHWEENKIQDLVEKEDKESQQRWQ